MNFTEDTKKLNMPTELSLLPCSEMIIGQKYTKNEADFDQPKPTVDTNQSTLRCKHFFGSRSLQR